ncbi:MAG: hypothetical protein HRU03_07120, partial [Nanoarchaeales archaeon]|nr:hypothetical protein [Nanoarchaeales archaeon]
MSNINFTVTEVAFLNICKTYINKHLLKKNGFSEAFFKNISDENKLIFYNEFKKYIETQKLDVSHFKNKELLSLITFFKSNFESKNISVKLLNFILQLNKTLGDDGIPARPSFIQFMFKGIIDKFYNHKKIAITILSVSAVTWFSYVAYQDKNIEDCQSYYATQLEVGASIDSEYQSYCSPVIDNLKHELNKLSHGDLNDLKNYPTEKLRTDWKQSFDTSMIEIRKETPHILSLLKDLDKLNDKNLWSVKFFSENKNINDELKIKLHNFLELLTLGKTSLNKLKSLNNNSSEDSYSLLEWYEKIIFIKIELFRASNPNITMNSKEIFKELSTGINE